MNIQGLITTEEIKKKSIETIPVDLSVIPVEHRTRFFNPGELDTLAALIKSVNPKIVAEFGCQNGRTAKVLLNHIPSIEIYIGVDVPPYYETECEVQRSEVPEKAGELALDDDRFVLMLNQMGTRGFHSILPMVDAVFIDGDHSYEGVINDHALALRIVRPGGIIIHHDYHTLGTVGVQKALNELVKDNEIYHVPNTWLCYQNIN